MTSVCGPDFRAVELRGGDDCPVNFQFVLKANSSLLPDVHPQSPKGAACLGDSVVDLSINVGIAEECTTHVCEGFYRLKGLSIHCYLRLVVLVSWSWLKCHFRLFGAAGKTKVVAG